MSGTSSDRFPEKQGLQDLEQQLDLAEVRCGTLRGQLDYMKSLYPEHSRRPAGQQRTPRVRILSPRPAARDSGDPGAGAGMGPDAVLYPGAYLDPLQLLANHPAYKPRPRPDVPLAPTAPIFSFSTSPAAPTHPLPSPGEFLLPPSPRFPFKVPAPDVSLKAAVNPIAEILRSLEPSTALFAPLAGAGSPSGPGQSHGQRFTTGMDSADLYPTKLEGLKASSAPTPADAWSSLLVRSRPRQTTAPDTACGLTGSTATSPFLGAADPIQPDAQPAAPAAAPDLKLAASSWSREPLRSPSYTLTSLLRQHGRGTLPKRSPPVVDFTAGFGLSAGTTPDPAEATPAQSQPIQDDAGLDLNPTKTSPPDVDLSARFASSFLRQAYQSCAEAEAATQTEAEVHSKAPAARDADVPRPSEDQSLREAMQHKTAAPADDQEPWRQVLGLVHGLAENMKRMASDHCEPAAAPAAEEGRRRGPPEAAAVDVADPWDDPSELRRPGTPGTDSASSGGSVYEDPLADTPRAPRMLLRRDVELYSNEHFHPESADDDRDSCSSEDSPAMHAASGHSQQSVVIAGLAEIDGLLSSLDSASELPLLPLLPLDLGPVRGADDGGEADCRPPGPAATAGAPTERDPDSGDAVGCESSASSGTAATAAPPPAPPPSESMVPGGSAASAADPSTPPTPPTPTTAIPRAAAVRRAPHYERPTTSSRLKRRSGGPVSVVAVAGPVVTPRPSRGRAAVLSPRRGPFPFVAATSTSRSHNAQLSLQAVMSQRKMGRPSTSPSTTSPSASSPRASAASARATTPRAPSRPRLRPCPAGPAASTASAAPCPSLNADIGVSDGEGDASHRGGSAATVCSTADKDEAPPASEDGEDKPPLSPQGRWAAEASSKCRSAKAASRCQCYPRHVAEYDRVLKPFLRKATQSPPSGAPTRCKPATRPRLPRPRAYPFRSAATSPLWSRPRERPWQLREPIPSAVTIIPQECDNNNDRRLDDLRAVLVSLRKDLVALGEARDRERDKWDSGRGSHRRLRELEDSLHHKEAEVRLIVDLYRQVQLLRNEMSNIR